MKAFPLASRALVLAAALLACAAQAQTVDTLKNLKERGTVSIGVREASGALSYAVGAEQYVGFHIDVCKQVVADLQRKLGLDRLEIRYTSVTNANRMPLMTNGTLDMECGSTTNTAARQRDVAFAPTLFVETIRMLVRADSGITSIEQLGGKTVTSATGGTAVQHLRKHKRAANADFKEVFVKDNAEAFLMLENRRADAFVNDSQILATLISSAKDPGAYRIVGESLSTEPIAIMLPKGDPAFKSAVDDSIRAMVASGQLARIYDTWFMRPIPPRQVAVNLPASEATRAAWADLNDRPMESYAAP
ncbi:MAG TPA: amino acid ABC transporter substrate-binding protein [Pseudorhodoferax sp.]|nr:amino acid ABC transporter substrate-binding protein [Pseudorhodoferax sp.]